MLAFVAVSIAGLGFAKYQQIQAAVAQGAAFQPPPEAVTTIVAQQEQWPATLSAIGTAAPVQGVVVSADLPGIVERIAFESGGWVREGDVLVQLDTQQEQAQLTAAQAESNLARLNLERRQGLVDQGAISGADYDRAAAEQ
jgi:membrane fusion protein (multidrug efflux system)